MSIETRQPSGKIVGNYIQVTKTPSFCRGNSIATKAMEAYIKLVGQKYLQGTLQAVVNEIIAGDGGLDLEVDPVRVTLAPAQAAAGGAGGQLQLQLARNRERLGGVVRHVWARIADSHAEFPEQLQRCFYKIR